MSDTELYSEELLTKGVVKKSYIYSEFSGLQQVSYKEIDGRAVLEGDIVLGTAEEMDKITRRVESLLEANADDETMLEACSIVVGNTWEDGIIPYTISADFKNKSALEKAIEHIHKYTELRLVKRESQNDYVHFISKDGNWSQVGKIGRMQELSLSRFASMGNAVHEILHAAGMWHEHTRNDRDNYVKINWGRIQADNKNNFNQNHLNHIDLNVYDYDSIMHYDKTTFSKSLLPTIEPYDTRYAEDKYYHIGQRNGLSVLDRLGLQLLYLHNDTNPIIDLDVIVGKNTQPKPGYKKIQQDLNEKAGDAFIYLCYKKGQCSNVEDMKNAVTDICFVKGKDAPAPFGYKKINVDLNRGAGGKYIYLCYKIGGGVAITNVTAISGGKELVNVMVAGFNLIPQDLSESAGGKYIYLCYQRDPKIPIADVTVISGGDCTVKPPAGYDRINVDTNVSIGGKYVYIASKRADSSTFISELAVIIGGKGVKTPGGFERINKDLSEGAGGKFVYLCKKTTRNKEEAIKDVIVIYGSFYKILPPSGYIKIHQDLNQGHGGNFAFVCYKK